MTRDGSAVRAAGGATIVALLVAGCGPAPAPKTAPAPATPAAVAFQDDAKALPRYHSKRLALSLPLPDGRAWQIDDHSQPELVATHAPTRSRIVVAILRADELVGRSQCEDLARSNRLVPKGDLQTLETEVAITQQTFDTRIAVAVAPGNDPDEPLTGYVMAFGGFLRKCYVFVFSTKVERAAEEPVLSSRLAFARTRILRGLELDLFGIVPREGF